MKFVAVSVLVSFFLMANVDAASVSLSSNELTLNGNANIRFFGPREEIWNGLANGHRFPIINSGDTIALRSAYPSGSYQKYWLYCITSYCVFTTCPGTVMTSSKWSSCTSHMKFKIHAMNKMDGQPINSGDTVSISSTGYGSNYRLRCSTSTSYKCRFVSTTSSFKGNSWLNYYYAVFQIFSRNAVDGTPVQYGDIVGFKYPYGGSSYWLYRYSSYFYARSCSSTSKYSCAAQNTVSGFKIFKKL
ncbi:uncharacterized protein [Montipora capricornis]|uniref:uncharacterized protein isoform X1 n=1 Tax=Montipora foliosa TaxID=591990 RepID=UPI0035F188F3